MKRFFALLLGASAVVFCVSSCGKEEKIPKSDPVSFEGIVVLNEDGYYNGSDGSGGFSSSNAIFKIDYSDEYKSWTGFAVSTHTDTITPDFSNQYSSITGSGAGKSETYAVLYTFTEDTIEFKIPAIVSNIGISNSTYAYYSMKNGDGIAKKFGGETGNDPDFFDLHISTIDEKGQRGNFPRIPLADYTYTDNSQDYISKNWIYYDLSDAGYVKYLIFSFASSDTSAWGFNTPAYVCIDNLVSEWEE